jgi:Rrf2 family transcriptional regulator, iron-sulfur cluster assembly transcription factor
MLNQASTYAISALSYAARMGGRPSRIRAVAEACASPAPYLAKIVNLLARKKLVVTQRGVGGGVLLARPAEEITLYEVCLALDDEVLQPRCILGNVMCTQDRSCPAHGFCRSSREQLVEFLQQTTIADIAAFLARRTTNQATTELGNR